MRSQKMRGMSRSIEVLGVQNNLESDVENNLVEVDEMRFIEGNVMETNSDNEREEYREELMVKLCQCQKYDRK